MMSYVYKNNNKSIDDIKNKILYLYNVDIIQSQIDNIILGNQKLLFNIEDKVTNILLLEDDVSIREISSYLRGNSQ